MTGISLSGLQKAAGDANQQSIEQLAEQAKPFLEEIGRRLSEKGSATATIAVTDGAWLWAANAPDPKPKRSRR